MEGRELIRERSEREGKGGAKGQSLVGFVGK
jgi:hypothetical protein